MERRLINNSVGGLGLFEVKLSSLLQLSIKYVLTEVAPIERPMLSVLCVSVLPGFLQVGASLI